LVSFPPNFRGINAINTDIYFLTNVGVKTGRIAADVIVDGENLADVLIEAGMFYKKELGRLKS